MSDNKTTPRKPTRRGRATQAAFDAAARKVIEKKGILRATVADIAAESGRSTASFYNYYDSKEDLLAKWAESFQKDAYARSVAAYEKGLSPRERVYRATRAHVQTYREHMAEITGVFQLAMVNNEFARYWYEICQLGVSGISDMIGHAQEKGQCSGLDSRMAASAIVSMLNQYCYECFSPDGMVDGADDEIIITTIAEIWYRTIYGAVDSDKLLQSQEAPDKVAGSAG